MCINEVHRCISIPNMTFLCLNLWLREVCTDADANDDDNANDDASQPKTLNSEKESYNFSMCTKCEVCLSNPVARTGVHRQCMMNNS